MFLPSWGPILFRIIIMVCNTRRETFGHLRKVLFVISLHSLRRLTPKRHFRFYIIFLFWASLLFPVFSSLSTMFSKSLYLWLVKTRVCLEKRFVWKKAYHAIFTSVQAYCCDPSFGWAILFEIVLCSCVFFWCLFLFVFVFMCLFIILVKLK